MQSGPLVAFLLLLMALLTPALLADEPLAAVLEEQRVREPTPLDWEFAAGGGGAPLPVGYDSRRQRYQLWVPALRTEQRLGLVLHVDAGDQPDGWRHWRRPCERAGWAYAAPVGAGTHCPPAQRVRAVLDVLADVRRRHRLDADRTYLVGVGPASSALVAQVAFALPDYFGGVVLHSGGASLPRLDHLRHRAADRLSIALLSGPRDAARGQVGVTQELLLGAGLRARVWALPGDAAAPSAEALGRVQLWLEQDRRRRGHDSQTHLLGAAGLTRRELARRAVDTAKIELARPERLGRAAALLEWVVERCGNTEAGGRAAEVLRGLDQDALRQEREGERRRVLAARGRAFEKAGRYAAAQAVWLEAARFGTGSEQKDAAAEARRLGELESRRPALGVTFAGATTAVRAVREGGPGDAAGLRRGDVLVEAGGDEVRSPEDVRERLARAGAGDELAVVVLRDGRRVGARVRLGGGGGG